MLLLSVDSSTTCNKYPVINYLCNYGYDSYVIDYDSEGRSDRLIRYDVKSLHNTMALDICLTKYIDLRDFWLIYDNYVDIYIK